MSFISYKSFPSPLSPPCPSPLRAPSVPLVRSVVFVGALRCVRRCAPLCSAAYKPPWCRLCASAVRFAAAVPRSSRSTTLPLFRASLVPSCLSVVLQRPYCFSIVFPPTMISLSYPSSGFFPSRSLASLGVSTPLCTRFLMLVAISVGSV